MKKPNFHLTDLQQHALKILGIDLWYLKNRGLDTKGKQQRLASIDDLMHDINVLDYHQPNAADDLEKNTLEDKAVNQPHDIQSIKQPLTGLKQSTSSKNTDASSDAVNELVAVEPIINAETALNKDIVEQTSQLLVANNSLLQNGVKHFVSKHTEPQRKVFQKREVYGADTQFISAEAISEPIIIEVPQQKPEVKDSGEATREIRHQKWQQQLVSDYSVSDINQLHLNNLKANEDMVLCPYGYLMFDETAENSAAIDTVSNHYSQSYQLLNNILTTCGLNEKSTYHSYFNKDRSFNVVDEQLLVSHLKQEIALAQPRRLFVFGFEIVQMLLAVQSPIGHLMSKNWELSISDLWAKDTYSTELYVFPDTDYLLNVPNDKALVWQAIKNYQLNVFNK